MTDTALTDIGLKYFSRAELQCHSDGSFQLQPAEHPTNYPGFGARIDALREAWGKPLIVNSCCRSAAYNATIDESSPHSLHVWDTPCYGYLGQLGTAAIDLREVSQEFRVLAWSLGFSLGLGNTFTHCDDRSKVIGLPQAKFTYAIRN